MGRRYSISSGALALFLLIGPAGCGDDVDIPGRSDGGPDVSSTPDGFPTSDSGGPNGADAAADNEPPGSLEIAVTPKEPTTEDTIAVTVVTEAEDPDGGPEELTYVVTWYRDDQVTNHGALSIPPAVTRRGETWRVEVRAFDGVEEGPAAEAEVEIVNSPPTVAGATLSPPTPTTDQPLVCEAGKRSDPDGDDVSLSYAWSVDDDEVPEATSGAMQPPLEAGVAYRCRVTPFDGAVEGEAAWSNEVVPQEPDTGEELNVLISFQPKSLDMGLVLPGETNEREAAIYNNGADPLEITAMSLTGDPYFEADLDLPLTVEPGGSSSVEVTFSTDEPGLKKGALILESNASNPSAGTLPLLGVGAAPCLEVQPSRVDFGGAYTNSNQDQELELVSCGALPVSIGSIAMAAPGGSPFSLDLSTGPGAFPWTLEPGETQAIRVAFAPNFASPTDDDGNPIEETAEVSFQRQGGGSLLSVPVKGWASELGCPNPVIEVVEGSFVKPGRMIHLNGSKSFAPGPSGKPTTYSWAVKPPDGAPDDEPILPSPDDEEITYQTSAPGPYEFQLKVFDIDEETGQVVSSCVTAVKTVTAKDAVPLIVELSWETPGDPIKNDTGLGAGADLDVHMHRGGGSQPDYDGDGVADTWFDLTGLDLFWFWLDTNPDWSPDGEGPSGPELVTENSDGTEPERIEYEEPVVGDTYTVGVHYWSDYGISPTGGNIEFGPSIVTVRVWYFENLVHEVTDVVLERGDLWEVGIIRWPHGDELIRSFGPAGGPKVTPDYPNPFQDD